MKLETFFENFELLTDAPNVVDELRAIIRQIAVCGKLVAQNFEDEPASKLIQETQVKKQLLWLDLSSVIGGSILANCLISPTFRCL